MPVLISANGVLFYIVDEGVTGVHDAALPDKWHLAARDAFNGTLLWKIPLEENGFGWRAWHPEKGEEWEMDPGRPFRTR